MQLTEKLGVAPGAFLLPKTRDLYKWSVVACDQHTSDPAYWDALERLIGGTPSSLRLILPEARLGGDLDAQVRAINGAMAAYLAEGVFRETREGFVFVKRTTQSGTRRGLLCLIDLESYAPDGTGLVRPTEETVPARVPPRMRIRRGAPLELTHVMLLMDDRADGVFRALEALSGRENLYDCDLNGDGGHLSGTLIAGADAEDCAGALLDAAHSAARINGEGAPFIVIGDGNHSLAAAKGCWEEHKAAGAGPDHPARFASAELVNIHDPAVRFEPIHRVVTDIDADALENAFVRFASARGRALRFLPGGAFEDGALCVPCVFAGTPKTLVADNPDSRWAVHVVQELLDDVARAFPNARFDYIHGGGEAREIGARANAAAFLLPAIDKDTFFARIAAEGRMPRKTFSIGEPNEKRYYAEARGIR